MIFALLKESFLFAFQALVANKLRSFLSLLGITIGIFAIISVFTMTDALEVKLRNSIKSLGDNVIYIQKWPWSFGPDYPWWKYIDRPLPIIDELDAVKRLCTKGEAFAFMTSGNGTVKYKNNNIDNADLLCTSYEYNLVHACNVINGRYFTELESLNGRPVCIVGHNIAQGLFGTDNPVGEYIKVKGNKVLVIGVLKKEGESMFDDNVDDQVIIPANYARNFIDFRNEKSGPLIAVKAKPGVTNEELIDELTGVMRSVRKLKPVADNDFALNQTTMISTQMDGLFNVVGIAGWVIGGFSILVGGFGIANIMFVSVKERTNLIGIQKSLGAKNYFILFQFLSEAVLLSLIGGIIGLIITFSGTLIATSVMDDMEIQLTQSNIILGLTISILIGVVSGFVPSYNASQLDPVEAIRSH